MKPPVVFSNEVDAKTLDAGWQGIRARRASRQRTRRALVLAPVIAAAALVAFLALGRRPVAPALEVAAPHVIALSGGSALPESWAAEAASTVSFDDGSHIELASGAVLHPRGTLNDPARVDLVLERGSTTFDIRPGGPRAWTIEAGLARVRVLGTRFTVARSGDRVHVDVERGKVRVESARIEGGGRDLVAGEAVDVAAPAAEATASPVPVRAVESLPSEASSSGPKRVAAPAPSAKASETAPAAPDRMARADAARAAGQPKEALAILASVVDDAEPNAPLAAFTMGKIHSETLGDALAGARWFERAIALGLPAGLDEDAHARVVECYARAGRAEDAARAAERYEAKFPTGRHLARVRRWKKE